MKYLQSENKSINEALLRREDSIRKSIASLSEEESNQLREEIQKFYFGMEYGLKMLAKHVLGVSYTDARTTFSAMGIEFRRGRNITTNAVKEFRKEKAVSEVGQKIGFASPNIARFDEDSVKGIQGYYWNASKGKFVWLRSTYEYIYAKFLNRIGEIWDIETTRYSLSDGTDYRPDFFIYDSSGNLLKVVEIKGYWDNRSYKAKLLKDEYFSDSAVEVILIKDIKIYIDGNISYGVELKTWKQIRKSKESI